MIGALHRGHPLVMTTSFIRPGKNSQNVVASSCSAPKFSGRVLDKLPTRAALVCVTPSLVRETAEAVLVHVRVCQAPSARAAPDVATKPVLPVESRMAHS